VSVKLTPEICISKASSNSRLTAVGRWATASHSHSQNCLQTLFFSLSLPLIRQKLNYTCMLKNLLKLYCIWSWDTLWCFVWFGLVSFPFDKTMTELLLRHHLRMEAEGLTPNLLRLKLSSIWTWRFFYFFYFLFFLISIFIYFLFYFLSQSSLCLSNACSAYTWFVHYLSLFISFKLFVCFGFFVCWLVFPFL
jgi:hypothetical protein